MNAFMYLVGVIKAPYYKLVQLRENLEAEVLDFVKNEKFTKLEGEEIIAYIERRIDGGL